MHFLLCNNFSVHVDGIAQIAGVHDIQEDGAKENQNQGSSNCAEVSNVTCCHKVLQNDNPSVQKILWRSGLGSGRPPPQAMQKMQICSVIRSALKILIPA